jgi:KUP system potassium uptake protein
LTSQHANRSAPTLALAALGIVYGDLGTSPLYTYQAIVGTVGGHPSTAEALGLLSLVIWALVITVSIKYCVIVMRADNHGEGGILALMSLIPTKRGQALTALTAMGLFGAALIYGDGIITPAISVLSALEGINVATDAFKPYILPAALAILIGLFMAQQFGTSTIGRIFGPVMLLWFATIGVLGAMAIARRPEVLYALNPLLALAFLAHHGWQSFIVLGGVFLAITGGEALYADMGHIGRSPIQTMWFALVLPALLLCYAGQTALLLENPGLEGNPFFKLAPDWAVVPLVVLATLATIIASQAIITGAFSLTRQAMQLGWFPGLRIRQTSDQEYGQIYVPLVNWGMMLCTLALTYGFGSSDRLAGAYGTAVSTTMLLTTALLYNVMRDVWRWSRPLALTIAGLFLVIDLSFFAANLLKILDGGWIPLLLGAILFTVMVTWRSGIDAIRRRADADEETPEAFLRRLEEGQIPRVRGTAVFLTRTDAVVPHVVVRHVTQFKALPEVVIGLTVRFEEVPRVAADQRATVHKIEAGLWHMTVRYGFVEVPSLTQALAAARDQGCPLDLDGAVFFAAHDEVVRCERHPRMWAFSRGVFAFLYRNALRAPDRFDLPADRYLELSRQVEV